MYNDGRKRVERIDSHRMKVLLDTRLDLIEEYEALDVYIPTMKKDPLYKLTANVKEASKAESEEILSEIESLTDDDLEISTVKRVTV